MGEIQLEYAVPAADVAEFVTLFYRFQAEVPLFEDVERADNAQIRIRLRGGLTEYRMPDGTVQHGAAVHLLGPTSGATRTRVEGPIHGFGWGMTPTGWAALIGADASTMLNRTVDARTLFGDRMDAAITQLMAAPDLAAMVAIAEPLVRSLAQGAGGDTIAFVRLVDAWLAGSPSPEVEDLVQAVGLSRRQVERRCKALYGAPPKLLARKFRALKAAVAMYSEGASAADLIMQGFYDQSHLIREIKQFTGLTPRRLKDEMGALAKLTMRERFALEGVVSPLVSGT